MPCQRAPDGPGRPGLVVLTGVAAGSRSVLGPHTGRAGTRQWEGEGDEADAGLGPDRIGGNPRLRRESPGRGDLLVVRRLGADPDRDRRGAAALPAPPALGPAAGNPPQWS